MHRGLGRLASSLVAIALAGCGGDTPTATSNSGGGAEIPTAGSRGTIGFSALTLKNPFFKIIADSLTAEAERHGFKVMVNDAERDVNAQARHIDDYIAQQVTAIVINPADKDATGPAVKRANDAGIPVFTCDLECTAPGVKIAGHIGTDNKQGGRLAGEAMIEALGDAGGDVLILHFAQANSCVDRVQGFREVIDRHNAGREMGKITLTELEAGGLQDEGFRVTADALQAHPELRGIFAINDPSGLGAWTALNQAGKSGQVVIVAFDGQMDGKQAIRDGKIYADPIQFPAKMGTDTVRNIVKYLDGEPFDENVLIPTKLYKKADADQDPELQPQGSPGTP
jgi:ribose transport system substrate-binding protein